MKHALTSMILLVAVAGTAAPAVAKGPFNCPPGLAKKSPACVPPGQAKKQSGYYRDDHGDYHYRDRRYDDDEHHYRYRRYDGDYRDGDYRRGDRLPDGYRLILVPEDYGLRRRTDGSDYYIRDGVVYRANRETREVLDLYRALEAILD